VPLGAAAVDRAAVLLGVVLGFDSPPSARLCPPVPISTRSITARLKARRRSCVAASAGTSLRALIMPQPMSKPTGPIATAPVSASVRMTQPTGTP
jgi:cyanophycinase-like exopeptidase